MFSYLAVVRAGACANRTWYFGDPLVAIGIDLLIDPASPTHTRGKTMQFDTSAIQALGHGWFWDSLQLVGEAQYIHILSATPVGGVSELTNGTGHGSKNAWAYSTQVITGWNNVVSGWDISVPITFAAIAKGSPPPGTFGALYGEGDQRDSVGITFSYLQRLSLGLTYSGFLGTPNVEQHPYADRDNIAFSAKYQF